MHPMPPCSDSTCWWRLQALGVAVRHIICGVYLFIYLFIFPPGYVALWDSKTSHRPTSENVSWYLETSLLRLLPRMDLRPYLFCLSFYLLYFVLPPLKTMGCLSGCWCPLPAFRGCFVEFSQRSNVLSMNLWGRKWSPRPIPLPS